MPEHATLNMLRAPALILMALLNFAVALVGMAALAWGCAVGPRWITPPSALLLFLAGVVAIVTGELVREGARKPCRNCILAPGVRVEEVSTLRRQGLIPHIPWLRYDLERTLPPDSLARPDRLAEPLKAQVEEALFLSLFHGMVLGTSAVSRQIVQFRDLQRGVDLGKVPVRGEGGGFALFGVFLVLGLVVLTWIARTVLRSTSPTSFRPKGPEVGSPFSLEEEKAWQE